MRRHSRLLSKIEEDAKNDQEDEMDESRSNDDFDGLAKHDQHSSVRIQYKNDFQANAESLVEYIENWCSWEM